MNNNGTFTLRCIICRAEFSESDIEVTEATDILMCDLCAYERIMNERSN
jgi:DNA-directed RNA polymerase subunit RPC12/RpoP